MSLPVTIHETFEPKELLHTPAGELVFDMGQEFTGIFKLHVNVPAGTKIHVQTGEILQRGNFYNDNLRSANPNTSIFPMEPKWILCRILRSTATVT